MLHVGKIKLRDIKELQGEDVVLPKTPLIPLKKFKNIRPATTSKKVKDNECASETVIDNSIVTAKTQPKSTRRNLLKVTLRETPSNQKRIDSYFTTCPKTFDIKEKTETPSRKLRAESAWNKSTNKNCSKSLKQRKSKRKRLFAESIEPSVENMSATSCMKGVKIQDIEYITIDSDSEEENNIKKETSSSSGNIVDRVANNATIEAVSKLVHLSTLQNDGISLKSVLPTTASSLSFGQRMSNTSCENSKYCSKSSSIISSFSRRKPKPCPSYKIVENTAFAVDAFQFGYIENVNYYFLTHFHADHYIGLTRSFAMPLYMSPITARLVRTFIPIQEQYIHELELNQPCIINNIEVTALEANHCPGAIVIVFKFLDSGKCILHTGDFRACHEMESEPIFWNNHIHTIYLDTTYISDKYAFCTQYESIMKAEDLIEKFLVKHAGKRILYICGSYIIGKEKFWSSLAEKYDLKVWAEGNRHKALQAINDERFNRLLVKNPYEANMHLISMGKVSYLELVEYFHAYEQQFDMIFAIRPSGWEKDTKPRYGSKINLVGIEYSEHSSYAEMQRFVKFLKPDKVISTVPTGKDLMKTAHVPIGWYQYETLKSFSNYQPSIQSYLGRTPFTKSSIRLPNANKGGLEHFVSPLKLTGSKKVNDNLEQISLQHNLSNEIYELNREECQAQKSRLNLQTNKIKAKSNQNILATGSTSSSEDFEKLNFIVKTKNVPRNKTNIQKNYKTDQLTQAKQQRNKKQFTPKNTSAETTAINSKEEVNSTQITNTQIKDKKKKSDKKTKMLYLNNIDYPSEEQLNNSQPKKLNPVNKVVKNHDSEHCLTQARLSRTKTKSNTSSNASSSTQTGQQSKELNFKSQIKYTTSETNFTYKLTANNTINSKTNVELNKSNETIKQENLEIPKSTKRMNRSKSSGSTKLMTISHNCQNNTQNGFEPKLVKLSEQNFKIINTGSKIKSIRKAEENPMFQSTTESTADPTSADEKQMKTTLKAKSIKTNSATSSEDCFKQFGYTTRSVLRCKRKTSNHGPANLKKSKPSIDTQTILKTILEQNKYVDRFNCSQIADLVVETIHKHNPDFSQNHIPPELLSDADDDWM